MRAFSVSTVAGCIGLNPYEDISDALEAIWSKEDRNGYYTCVNSMRPKESLAKKRFQLKKALASDEAKKMKVIQQDTQSSTSDKVNNIMSVEKTTLSDEQHKLLVKHCKSKTSTSHGVRNEASALSIYADETDSDVEEYNKVVSATYNDKFCIRGKVDGIVPNSVNGEFKIVEIKNRARRLFGKVVGYEYCQTQLYLYINDQQNCDLVECFNGEINIFPIERDNEYIDLVLRKLAIVDSLISELKISQDVQKEYMKADDKNQYLFSKLEI